MQPSGHNQPTGAEHLMTHFSLLDLLTLPSPIRIVDLGAMMAGDEVYATLVARGGACVTGFEPIPEERERLIRTHPGRRYLPYVVGDGSRRIFHTCRYAPCSSLYEPDQDVLQRFSGMSGAYEVIGRQEVTTVCLDTLSELGGCDFLKLDVQGAELDVFRGARNLLADVLVIQVEVEFVPFYRGRPLFAEIDLFLRECGFMLHKLVDVCGRPYQPFRVPNKLAQPMSQILWADAIYIPAFVRLDSLPPERLCVLATILHDLFGSIDLCAHVLQLYERHTGLPLRHLYLKRFEHEGEFNVAPVTIRTWTD